MGSRGRRRWSRSAGPIGLVIAMAAALLAGGCQPAMLSLDDTVKMGDRDSPIRAYVMRKGLLQIGRRVPDVEVVFYVDGKEITRGKTNELGRVDVQHRFGDDVKRFEATAVLGGDECRAEAVVYHWPERTVVVVDIDETISNTDHAALLSGADKDVGSTPLPDSVETLSIIAKHFNVFYLTARPRELLAKSRGWIETHGFPAAPVVTSDTLGDLADQRRYKRNTLANIQELVPHVLIGIGDRATDSEAYGESGLLTIVLGEGARAGFRAHAVVLPNWKAVGNFFRVNVDTLKDPQRAKQALTEGGILLRPTIPWTPPQ